MQYPKSSFFQKRGRNGIQAIKQSSNQAIKQRYHTFIAFTKTYLKIPYFLLFPLALTLLFSLSLIRATTFLNHLIP
ncbi:hypothetical protein B0X69_04200 [Helicobacter pylori]|uniref:Uncharacterized protein n=1 Tax=Helicobacter pylori TaxID=210 RepID=A0A4Y4WYR2_HELPX|nr:hypothetical protein B0X69_04200 [Helicobacter pylori]